MPPRRVGSSGRSTIQREVQRRGGVGKLVCPIPKARRHRHISRLLALPFGEIGVLNRELRQLRARVQIACKVQGRQLAKKNALRPAVEQTVVKTEREQMFVIAQVVQRGTKQRRRLEIERIGSLSGGTGDRGVQPVRPREIGMIDNSDRNLQRRQDYLHDITVDKPQERSEDFVALDEYFQTALQGVAIEWTGNLVGQSDVVRRPLCVEPVEHPQPALRERAGGDKRFDGQGHWIELMLHTKLSRVNPLNA